MKCFCIWLNTLKVFFLAFVSKILKLNKMFTNKCLLIYLPFFESDINEHA